MKRSIVALSLLAITGCSSPQPTAPTITFQIDHDGTVTRTAAPATEPPPVVTGPTGCVSFPQTGQTWDIPTTHPLTLALHWDAAAGCAPTVANPRQPGTLTTTPTPTGQRVDLPLTAWGSWFWLPCGRVQVDISDHVTNALLVGMIVNYGVDCPLGPAPPPPAAPGCPIDVTKCPPVPVPPSDDPAPCGHRAHHCEGRHCRSTDCRTQHCHDHHA